MKPNQFLDFFARVFGQCSGYHQRLASKYASSVGIGTFGSSFQSFHPDSDFLQFPQRILAMGIVKVLMHTGGNHGPDFIDLGEIFDSGRQ